MGVDLWEMAIVSTIDEQEELLGGWKLQSLFENRRKLENVHLVWNQPFHLMMISIMMVVVMVVFTASITIVIFWPPCQSLECPFPRGISPRQEAAAKIMINWRTVINMIIILLLDISSSSPPPPLSSSPKSSTWNSVSSLPWTTCWWILRWIFISWSIYKKYF